MAEQVGKMVMCDRCGEQVFLKHVRTESLDGGYAKVDHFEPKPAGWGWQPQTGTLCKDCQRQYDELLSAFLAKTKEDA